MVTVKRPHARPPKRERIKGHIEELTQLILNRYPEARFDVASVPDTKWPGLYVYLNLTSDSEEQLYGLVNGAQERFFADEWMTVYVFVRQPNGASG